MTASLEGGLRKLGLLGGIALLAFAGALLLAGQATALQVKKHTFSSSFDGTGSTTGKLGSSIYSVAPDEETGDVYALTTNEEREVIVSKFDATGKPLAFSGLAGATSFVVPNSKAPGDPAPTLVVDNSGTSTQGRFYVSDGFHAEVFAFEASGKALAPIVLDKRAVGIADDPNTGNLYVLYGETQSSGETYVESYAPNGTPLHTRWHTEGEEFLYPNALAIGSDETLYLRGFTKDIPGPGYDQEVAKYSLTGEPKGNLGGGFPAAIAIDPLTNDAYAIRYDGEYQVGELNSDGTQIDVFRSPLIENPSRVGVDGQTGTVYLSDNSNEGRILIFTAGPPVTIPGVVTGGGEKFEATSITLNGTLDPEGVPTSECRFEYGTSASISAYEHSQPCSQGEVLTGSSQKVTATITGLTKGAEYHFRLVAKNVNGFVAGHDHRVIASGLPTLSKVGAGEVHTDVATLHATVNAEGADTHYHFEFGTSNCALGGCTPGPEIDVGAAIENQNVNQAFSGLAPNTTYHYRIVAVNQSGTSTSSDLTLHTFALNTNGSDPCANAHVRQQTGAVQLLDCRAYELVSAADTAGYDVESTVIAGREPYGGFPYATSPPRVLYAVYGGGIPGTDHPTNRGPDPYVATRTESGWTTEYVGVSAENPYSAAPFSSRPTGAADNLTSLAFGGPEGCSPCFAGGYTGIPVRLANGALVQGMTGDLNPGPGARDEGFIGKDLSADGSHLIFGSKSQFESDGNSNGDISIYDHDLLTGATHVVSKTPGGATMTGAGIAELDLSADGSRVVVGQEVSADADGNVYYHPYMNIGDSAGTIDLAPGATDGVLYDGMTADGSKVYFTTVDPLAGDTDGSADLYVAEISGGGATVKRVSTGAGGSGNTDACDPVANSNGAHWNTVGGTKDCSVVAVPGGIAADGGAVYFLSPELLDGGNGVADQPNLYVAAPGGAPRFVATLNAEDPLVVDALADAGEPSSAEFEVTRSGAFAAFATTAPIDSSYENAGFSEIYRSVAGGGAQCVSCDPTNVSPVGDAEMAADGLSLAEDGRVFFTTPDPLVSSDSDAKLDAYEWEGGTFGLISTGTSPFDSGLLSATADGHDAYFFTRDSLAPQDQNGPTMKIYDARSEGGFEFVPEAVPCKASDECHGPGSQPAAVPPINTVNGAAANVPPTPKQKKKHKKKKHHKKKHHQHKKNGGKNRGKHAKGNKGGGSK